MLAATLFFACIIALCAGAALEGSLAFARVSIRHAAARHAESGLVQARAQLISGLAAQVAAGTHTLQAPTPPASTSEGPFTLSATFALQGSLTGGGVSNTIANDVQVHPAIREGRVAATIVESVSAATGPPLAVRTEYLTLRTFDVPPYVTIDGVTDASGARDVPFEADAAGCNPASPDRCDTNNHLRSAAPADTRIHALSANGNSYVNADPPHAPPQTSWLNANAASDGWSR